MSSYQPRRSARLAAMAAPSTPVRASRKRACPDAPSKNATVSEFQDVFHEMDLAVVDTCKAINIIKDIVVSRGDHDELSAETLVSLTRAVWAIHDALEFKMRREIIRGDKNALESVPNFIARLKSIEEECYKDIANFRQYNKISRSIMIAIGTIGTTIRTSFYNM
jgi:hypothetical protein